MQPHFVEMAEAQRYALEHLYQKLEQDNREAKSTAVIGDEPVSWMRLLRQIVGLMSATTPEADMINTSKFSFNCH